MATRTAYLDYQVRGAGPAAAGVRTLGDALAHQKREALAAVPALRAAQQNTGIFGAVSQSASARIAATTNTLGPFGAGLSAIAREGPLAAQGLMAMVAQQERIALLSRASNIAILGGVSAMLAGGVAAVAYADNIIRGADAYSAMTARINIFTEGAVEAAQTQRALYEAGQETRQGVQQLTTLYTRLAPAVTEAGRAQADALRITELTSKALLIQGANVREAEASTVQFAQALASGVLRGDELRSLMESSPQLLRYIAQNLEINGKVGVAFGQLRNLGEQGLLKTEAIMTALLAAAPLIERDFVNAPKTAQQGWTILSDTITRTVGQISQATGVQGAVVDWLADLSKQLDGFRKQALLNPDALAPAEGAIRLIGDALDTAGSLAGGVVENFDLIVDVAEALIALKVGEVMAGWFSLAAGKAREAYSAVQAFRSNGLFLAGAAGDEIGATAAINAKAAANAAAARAAEMAYQADLKARTAAAARAAADAQSATVTELKATAGVNAARVSEAEAMASTLATQAERAEAQAKAASTAATNAAAAASARNAIAQEAEAAVTRNVTGAQALKAASGRALTGVYNLLGGAIGLVTIALGAALYAIVQSEQAWREKIDALRDAVVVSDELRAISEAMASATWAEVPALLAAADAHRRKAAAAREDAEASLKAAEARLQGDFWRNALFAPMQNAQNARTVNALREVVEAGRRDAFSEREADYVARVRARTVEARARAEENRTGRDIAGREISPERRAENNRYVAEQTAAALREVAVLEGRLRAQEAAAARDPENAALARGVTVYRRSFEAAAELANLGGNRPAPPPPPASDGKLSAEERRTLAVLEKVADAATVRDMMGRDATGSGRFRMTADSLTVDGADFVARSADEAEAAMEWREQIFAIMGASDELIAKTGQTRQALVAQAHDTLATALATSQAAQAEERWAEKLAEAQGESRAVQRAERDVAEAREQGVRITEEAANAYIALAVAKDRAKRAEEALQIARPVVQEVTREALDDLGALPERYDAGSGGMVFDFEAAMSQWAQARERILAESEARIREAMEAEVLAGTKTREEADAAVAAARLALETESAQQISDLWREQRRADDAEWRRRLDERLRQEDEIADAITGSLQDLAFGADPSDIGQRFMADLLESAWQELVSNPLNLAIKAWLRSLTDGSGGPGGGGLWSAVGSFFGNMFGGGQGYAEGGLPGVRQLSPGLIRGPGGPRDDRIPAWVSNEEFISSARATRENLPLLTALNAGWSLADFLAAQRFASGGLPGTDPRWEVMQRDLSDAAVGAGQYAPPPPNPTGRLAAAAVDVNMPVTLINNTGEPMTATPRRNATGGVDVLLSSAVRREVGRMGRDGDLAKAFDAAPKPRRR